MLLLCREGVETVFKILSGLLVVNIPIPTPLFHEGHLTGNHTKQIGTSPNQHNQHEKRLRSDPCGEPLKPRRIETCVADRTQAEHSQTDQQNLGTRQNQMSP